MSNKNTSMQIDKKEFKELLDEIKTYNKIDIAAQALQTKFASDMAGEEYERQKKELKEINENLSKLIEAVKDSTVKQEKTGSKIEKKLDSSSSFGYKPLRDIKDTQVATPKEELKDLVAGSKRIGGAVSRGFGAIGGGIKSFFQNPIEATKSAATAIGAKFEGTTSSTSEFLKDVAKTPEDFSIEGGRFGKAYSETGEGSQEEGLKKFNELASKQKRIEEVEKKIKEQKTYGFEPKKEDVKELEKLKTEYKEIDPRTKKAPIEKKPKEVSTKLAPIETKETGSLLVDQFGAPFKKGKTTEESKELQQPSAKQKIEAQGKAENPNIVDEPSEVAAEEAKKQTVTFNELLNTTKESLDQLKAIRLSLEGGSISPASKTTQSSAQPPAAPAEASSGGLSPLDLLGRGGAAGGTAGGAAGGAATGKAGAAAGKAGAAGAAKASFGAKALGVLKAGGAMLGKGAMVAGKAVAGAALAKPALIAAGVGLAAYGAYKGYKALTGDKKDEQPPGATATSQEDTEKAREATREQYQAGTKEEKESKERLEAFRKENPYDYRDKPTKTQEFLEMPGTGKFSDPKKQAEYDKLNEAEMKASRKVGEAREGYKKLDSTQDKITTKGGREFENAGGSFNKLDVLVNRFGYSKSDFLNEDGKSYSLGKINSTYEKEMEKDLGSTSKDKKVEPKPTESTLIEQAPSEDKPSFGDRLKSFFGFGDKKEEPPQQARQVSLGDAIARQEERIARSIEGRQAGGPVTEGKPYVVGEDGPEIMVPKESGKVDKNEEYERVAAEAKQINQKYGKMPEGDLGDGVLKRVTKNGYEISGGFGTYEYSSGGNFISYKTPTFSGASVKITAKDEGGIEAGGGSIETSYSAGPISTKQKTALTGETLSSSTSVDLGLAQVSAKQTGSGPVATSMQVKGGLEENAALRDEMTAQGGSGQPIVMNNVNNNSKNTYIPMKADPRPTHQGSALENYLSKTAVY